jgi:hypothetical protein
MDSPGPVRHDDQETAGDGDVASQDAGRRAARRRSVVRGAAEAAAPAGSIWSRTGQDRHERVKISPDGAYCA